MAIDIPFRADIDLGEGAKSLKALKQEFKDAQKELDGLTVGSEKYVQSLKKLGKIKDEIGDLNTTIKAFNPEGKVQAITTVVGGLASGFQAATGAAALFGGQSQDLEKALLKVQAVMAFTEGIKGIIGLGDGFRNLVSVLKSTEVGTIAVAAAQKVWNIAMEMNPIGLIILAITALIGAGTALISFFIKSAEENEKATATIKENTKALEDETAAIKKSSEELKINNDHKYNMAKASGESAEALQKLALLHANEAIELAKSNAEIAKNTFYRNENLLIKYKEQGIDDDIIKKQQELVSASAKRWEEESQNVIKGYADLKQVVYKGEEDKAQAITDAIKKGKDKQKADDDKQKAENKKTDEDISKSTMDSLYAQWQEEDKLALDKYNAKKQLRDKERKDEIDGYNQSLVDAAKFQQDYYNQELAQIELNQLLSNETLDQRKLDLDLQMQIEIDRTEATGAAKQLIEQKYAKLKKKLEQDTYSSNLSLAKASNDALQALSDLYFTVKKANLKKGSAEERKAAEQQFKINKALSIASATISGIQGVVNALSAQSALPEPYATALKVATAISVGLAAAANIAKISSTKFDDGGAGGGGGSGVADVGGGGSAPPPTINAPTSGNTQLNPDGTVQNNNSQNQTPTIKAYVVESEVTGSQKRVSSIESNAKIN